MEIDHLKGFILPCVGAFPEGMKRLKERGLDVLIRKLINGKPSLILKTINLKIFPKK